MTFIELSNLTEQHQPDYYELLLKHHALIIKEVGQTSKNTVSKALHINPSQFSSVFQCIIAYSKLIDRD